MNILKKASKNPLLSLQLLNKYLDSILRYPYRILLYKEIGILSYISTRSSIRNQKAIIIKNNAEISPFVTLWPSTLSIGAHTQINPGTAIYGNVKIGNYVMIAPNCMIAGGNHSFKYTDRPMMLQGSYSQGIIIEDDVWIGANSTITDGVTIGKGAIIGAHSLVTKSIPPYTIAYGSPAEIRKPR